MYIIWTRINAISNFANRLIWKRNGVSRKHTPYPQYESWRPNPPTQPTKSPKHIIKKEKNLFATKN